MLGHDDLATTLQTLEREKAGLSDRVAAAIASHDEALVTRLLGEIDLLQRETDRLRQRVNQIAVSRLTAQAATVALNTFLDEGPELVTHTEAIKHAACALLPARLRDAPEMPASAASLAVCVLEKVLVDAVHRQLSPELAELQARERPLGTWANDSLLVTSIVTFGAAYSHDEADRIAAQLGHVVVLVDIWHMVESFVHGVMGRPS